MSICTFCIKPLPEDHIGNMHERCLESYLKEESDDEDDEDFVG